MFSIILNNTHWLDFNFRTFSFKPKLQFLINRLVNHDKQVFEMFCCSFTACINYVFQNSNHISSFLLSMNTVCFLSGFYNNVQYPGMLASLNLADIQNDPITTFYASSPRLQTKHLLNIVEYGQYQPAAIIFHMIKPSCDMYCVFHGKSSMIMSIITVNK